ncbi:MAG: glycosyltransferase family 4 protein [bacterium]
MKLLIITQKTDLDANALSFFHVWIEEFAKQCEKVTVICLYKGRHYLPDNVRVLSLGKEDGESRIKYIYRFYKYIWQERKNYDCVFAHMNQIYVIFGWAIWRCLGKKIGLWYAHGKVSRSLKFAEKLTDIIFTSTKEGCRMNSKKIEIVGQGIDTEKFKVIGDKSNNDKIKILSVGRISPVKKIEVLIEAIEILRRDFNISNMEINIIGGIELEEEKKYIESLKKMVAEKNMEDIIHFHGAISYDKILNYFQETDIFAHTGNTGSLDKVILEAMACECPVVSCNDAVKEVLKNYNNLIYKLNDSHGLAEKLAGIMKMSEEERRSLGQKLREIVVAEHGLPRLVKKILFTLSD